MVRYRYSTALGAMVLFLVVQRAAHQAEFTTPYCAEAITTGEVTEGESLMPFSANSLTGHTMSITYSGGQRQRVLMFLARAVFTLGSSLLIGAGSLRGRQSTTLK